MPETNKRKEGGREKAEVTEIRIAHLKENDGKAFSWAE